MNGRGIVLCLCILVFLVPTSAENVTVFEGDSVVVADANWTLTWGQNYTFNRSGSRMYSDTYYMNMSDGPDRNISVTSDTPAQVNTTLWAYDFDDLSVGDTLIKLETEAVAGSKVVFTFTGVPSPGSDRYVVAVDGSPVNEFTTGGTLSWSSSDWSTKNVTVIYRKQTKDNEGSSGGSVDTFCYTDHPSDQYTWISTIRDRFVFEDVAVPGMESVTVQLGRNSSDFRICVELLPGPPNETASVDNAYRFYRVTADSKQVPITATTVRFAVNKNFADRYSDVVLQRYRDGWTALPTNQINTTETQYVYEAVADGFSYFAITGQTDRDIDTAAPSGSDTDPETEQTTDCGDGVCNVDETPATCLADCEPDQNEQEDAAGTTAEDGTDDNRDADQYPEDAEGVNWLSIVAGLLVAAVLSGTGYYAYRNGYDLAPFRSAIAGQETEEAAGNLETLHQEMMTLIEETGIQHPEFVETKLKQAEFALENNLDDVARNRLQEIKEHLEKDRQSTTSAGHPG